MVQRGLRANVPAMSSIPTSYSQIFSTWSSRISPRRELLREFERGLLPTLLLLALTLAGCDRNIEPYQPGEEAKAPDLARIFPAPAGAVGSAEGQGDAGDDLGQVPRGAVPPSRAEANGSGPGAAGGSAVAASGASDPITGEIVLPAELAMARPDGGVLFVIARPKGARGGPPLAVLRIPSPDFPLAFSIGPKNVMIPTMQFAGEISLSARLDADGNAMTRGAGDISSAVIESLEPGATGVTLTLSERG